jgi:hypothetical protein
MYVVIYILIHQPTKTIYIDMIRLLWSTLQALQLALENRIPSKKRDVKPVSHSTHTVYASREIQPSPPAMFMAPVCDPPLRLSVIVNSHSRLRLCSL